MAEEVVETTAAAPAEAKEAVAEEVKKSGCLELNFDENNTVLPDELKAEDLARGNGILESMVGYLKRFGGYKCVSISRIERMPKDEKDLSIIQRDMIQNFMLHGGTSAEDFKKAFANGEMAYIQLHEECPTLAKDGVYDAVALDGTPIKTKRVGMFQITANKDQFVPMIIIRTGPGLIGQPGTIGLITGDPFHQTTAAEIAAVLKKQEEKKA